MSDDRHEIMTFAIKYPVNVRSLPVKGLRVQIEADQRELTDLAKNHGLLSVNLLKGDLHVSPWKKRGVRVKGKLFADVIQACVVTLEPVPDHIDEEVEAVFIPDDSRLTKYEHIDDTGELFVDAEGPDTPEVFHGDEIDLGAFLEEFFELSLNPYPRKPGVEANLTIEDNTDEDQQSPFAILEQLKKR